MSSGLYQIRDKDLDTTLDLTKLRPYGDTMNDGKVQMSFTLPVKDDAQGCRADGPEDGDRRPQRGPAPEAG